MERDFKQWLALFRTSIANYQYYTVSILFSALTRMFPKPTFVL